MRYQKTILLRDNTPCLLRNGDGSDGKAVLENFRLTHSETDYLLTYPEESRMTEEGEAAFLREKTESGREIEIIALIDGAVVGSAGIEAIGAQEKVRHRAEFGISVARAFWGRGIGRALTEACIECARAAGYLQLELTVVAENEPAVSLYRSCGFVEYGRNPMGFLSRAGFQETLGMRLEL